MANAMDVANYFLCMQEKNEKEYKNDLTNLKMQKLCAYAQAFSLALLDKALFEEDIQAMKHGPVVYSLYKKYKKHERKVIPMDKHITEERVNKPFDAEQKAILELTYDSFGRKNAWALGNNSHKDFPGEFGSNQIIAQEMIKEFFAKNRIVKKFKLEKENAAHTAEMEIMPLENHLVNAEGVLKA